MACELAVQMVATMEHVKNTVRRGDDVTSFIATCSKNIRTLNLALSKAENIGTKVSKLFLLFYRNLLIILFNIF